MKKLFWAVLLAVGLGFSAQVAEPGLTWLVNKSGSPFSTTDHILGAGDTLWTDYYLWSGNGGQGIYFVSFDVDTFAACSSKIEMILREGNTEGEWDYQASYITIDHAPSDWDTTFELSFGPMAYFKIGFVSKNGSNDSDKVKNVKLFGVK